MAEEVNRSDHNNHSDDQHELKEFWGLSRMLMLGMLHRFQYNFQRYHPEGGQSSTEQPDQLISKVLYQAYAFRNSMTAGEDNSLTTRGSLLVIGQKIHNLLYRLHHDLLEHDISGVAETIPAIDRQLDFWNPDRKSPLFLEASPEAIDEYIEELYTLYNRFDD